MLFHSKSISGNDPQCDVIRTFPILFYAWVGLRPCLVEPRLKLGPLPIPCMIDELVWSVGGMITTGQGVSTPRKTLLRAISSTTNHTRDIEPGDYPPGLWHRLILQITLCSSTSSFCCRACYSSIGIMEALLSWGEGSEVIVQEYHTKINSVTVCIFVKLYLFWHWKCWNFYSCAKLCSEILFTYGIQILPFQSLPDRKRWLELQRF